MGVLTVGIIGEGEAQRQPLEAAVRASGRAQIAGRSTGYANAGLWRTIEPEVLLVELNPQALEAGLEALAQARGQLPGALLMAVGPMEPAQLIVAAMRAGANEYLEHPLRPAALEEALARCASARAQEPRPVTRARMFAVMGARGGCGTTTVAVNLALALQMQRRQTDPPVALVDAASLGHSALHLNLKPQFSLSDLIAQGSRMDGSLLASLMNRHESGLELLAGPAEPLPPATEEQHQSWLGLVRQTYGLVVVDLSSRVDGLTRLCAEESDRVLLVTQTDVVSLWSAAKVRRYLDPTARLRFEMVLNRYHAGPEPDLAGLEAMTHAPVLWKIPNAHEQVTEAIERGTPPVLQGGSELARGYRGLAANLLGRPLTEKRWWLPFARYREAT